MMPAHASKRPLRSPSRRPLGPALAAAIALSGLLGAALAPGAGAGLVPQDSAARIELLYWDSIKDSRQPQDYQAYLETYPQGKFAALAKRRAAYLAQPAAAGPAPDPGPGQAADTPTAPTAATPLPPGADPGARYELVMTANLRQQPYTSADIVTVLREGNPINVTGRAPGRNWYQITLDDGRVGYVHATLVRPAAPANR